MPFQVQKHYQDVDGIVHVKLSVQAPAVEESTGMLHGATGPVAVLAADRTIATLSKLSRPLGTDVSYYGSRKGLCTRLRHVPRGKPLTNIYYDGGDCRTDLRMAYQACLREETTEGAIKALPIFMDGRTIVGTEADMESTFRQFNAANTVAIVLGKEFVRAFNDAFCTVETIDLSLPDLDVAKRSFSPIQRCISNAWRNASRPPVYLAQSEGQLATFLYGHAPRGTHSCKYMVEALANDHIVGFHVNAGEANARIDSASKKLIVSMVEKAQEVHLTYIKTSLGDATLINTENEAEEAVATDSSAPLLRRRHDWFQDASPRQVVHDVVALAQKVLGVDKEDRTWSTWGPILQHLHGWKGTVAYLPFQLRVVQGALNHLQGLLPLPSLLSPPVFREVSQQPFSIDTVV